MKPSISADNRLNQPMYYFTSITANYLAKARVLCKTLKQHNKGCFFVLGVSGDLPPAVNPADEPFDDILFTHDLDVIPDKNIFFFKHNVTEVCTAVKPAIALTIIKKYRAQKVTYLDPDIMVFSSLKKLERLLDTHSMIFTPHQLKYEDTDDYIVSNEILFLKKGAFNLGFFSVKADKTGLSFLNWWHARLMKFCSDDDYELVALLQPNGLLGMYTDQKWIDLVPSFFDGYHILKDPGYNVCTWNMTKRLIKKTGRNSFRINGKPLRFFHFSGFDSGGHKNEMLRALKYNPGNSDALRVTAMYEAELKKYGQDQAVDLSYSKYDRYSNGELISKNERKILQIRRDIWGIFKDPFEVTGGLCYYKWVRQYYGNYLKPGFGYRKALNFFFPPGTVRRMFIGMIKRRTLLLISSIRHMYFQGSGPKM